VVEDDDGVGERLPTRAMSRTVRSRDVVGIPSTTTRSPFRIRPV
jgi:hypothetical protein